MINGAVNQIFVEKDIATAETHAIEGATAQFHQASLDHVDELNLFTPTKNTGPSGQG